MNIETFLMNLIISLVFGMISTTILYFILFVISKPIKNENYRKYIHSDYDSFNF